MAARVPNISPVTAREESGSRADAPARRIPRGAAAPTDKHRAGFATVVAQSVQSAHMKRYGTLEEQTAAILFLASAEASYITGTTLPVAGGDQG